MPIETSSRRELHLFILWNNIVRIKPIRDFILNDIKTSFRLVSVFEVHWKGCYTKMNLRRLCECDNDILDKSLIAKGYGPFWVIVVNVISPQYDTRIHNGIEKRVCSKMFDKREHYRSLIPNNPYAIHASITQQEAKHDLLLILGENILGHLLCNQVIKSNKFLRINQELIGSENWTSIIELFHALNVCVVYAIVNQTMDTNNINELHIACSSVKCASLIINIRGSNQCSTQGHINVNNKIISVKLREFPSNYILNNRKFNGLFYVLE